MRRAAPLLLLFALVGCASGGGGGTSPASASSAPRPAARTHRVALVEADGPGAELESFLARLMSECSDKGITVVDARLGGARLAALASEPTSAPSRRFQEEWPSDAYLSVIVTLPEGKARGTYMTDTDPMTGRRVERWIGNVQAETDVAVRLADARDGHVLATFSVQGTASVQGGGETGDPAKESVLDAAERAAKKLANEIK